MLSSLARDPLRVSQIGKQLRETTTVARGQRRLDRVERVGERAGDLVLVQLVGDGLDVAGVRLQPLVVVRGDAVAEDVNRLRLASNQAVSSSETNASS